MQCPPREGGQLEGIRARLPQRKPSRGGGLSLGPGEAKPSGDWSPGPGTGHPSTRRHLAPESQADSQHIRMCLQLSVQRTHSNVHARVGDGPRKTTALLTGSWGSVVTKGNAVTHKKHNYKECPWVSSKPKRPREIPGGFAF